MSADEVVDCFGGIVGAEDSRIVGCDIDTSRDKKRGKPERNNRGEQKRDVLCSKSLEEKLRISWKRIEGQYEDDKNSN